MRELSHIALIAKQKAVQAHWSVMMCGSGEGIEAKAGVKAGLAHGPVAFVEIAREAIAIGLRATADLGGGDVTARLFKARGLFSIWLSAALDEEAGVLIRMRHQPSNHVGIVRAVVGHLRHGSLAE